MQNAFRATLIILFAGFLTSCSGFLYYPDSERYVDERLLPVRPKELWIPSEGATRLHAWYFQSPRVRDQKPIIVFFHGNAQNLTVQFYGLYWLLEHGFDYVVFDYRGYGQSRGSPSPKKTLQDGVAVLRFVKTMFEERPIVVVGQSLGGAIAIRSVVELKEEVPVSFVVADSTFLSYRDAAKGVLGQSWITAWLRPLASLLLSDRYAPGARVRELSPTPLIVIHGTADTVVPFELGVELFETAAEPKEFWPVGGGQHVSAFWGREPQYRERFIERLKGVFPKKPSPSVDLRLQQRRQERRSG